MRCVDVRLCRRKRPDTYQRFLPTIGGFTPTLEREAIVSERAAFDFDELRRALAGAGLGDVESRRARLPGAWQAHWSPGRREAPAA
jgi:hypothetical protein